MAKVMKTDRSKVKRNVAENTGGKKFHQFQEGDNHVRILPGIEGRATPGTYYGLFHQHGTRVEGKFRSFRCLQDLDKWCPWCACRRYFDGKGEELFSKKAKDMLVQTKYFVNAALPDAKKIVLLQLSNSVISKLETLADGQWGAFDDPESGYWVNIHREGTGQGTRYPSVTPCKDDQGPLPDWIDLDDAHNLLDRKLCEARSPADMVMLLVDRFGDVDDGVEEALRRDMKKWKADQKKRADDGE